MNRVSAALVCVILILAIISIHGFPDGNRIVNGQDASAGQFPFQVLLRITSLWGLSLCGGTLISDQWVLTAAHCAQNAIEIQVTMGRLQSNGGTGGLQVTSREFIVHENYESFSIRNDVAVIKLPAKVNLTAQIQPVQLPSGEQLQSDFVNRTVIASGWGLQMNGGGVASTLQFASLNVISNQECKMTYATVIQPTTLCAVGPQQQSTCNGDSGGPLILADEHVLVGVTSFGHVMGCESGIAVGFSRVTSYLQWIHDKISNK